MRGLIFIVLLSALFTGMVCAEKLEVKKTVEPEEISVGDEVVINLEFTNPFNREIHVKIVDNNVFAGNGLNIQCLERILPAERSVALEYEPIVAYAAGNYTMDSARVTYTNPETGDEEEIDSNELDIEINEKTVQGLQQSGITTIYQCGGMNMRTTSSQQQQQQQSQQQPKDLQQRVNEMQQKNQDMNSLRQQMQQQMQEQRELEQQMQEMIEENENFQKMQKQLQEEGYKLQKREINPKSNGTGDFTYQYAKENEVAQIQGRMENGEMENLEKHSTEELRELQRKLEQNPEFQRMQERLQQEGYRLGSGNLSQIQNNQSEFNYHYVNSENRSANITGRIQVNGNITEIKIVKEENKNNRLDPIWLVLLIILIVILFFVTKKLKKKEISVEAEPEEEPIDFRKLALDMIREAKRMYSGGKKKGAYTKVSEAVRVYFKFLLNQKEELTDYEVVQLLKKTKHEKLGTTRECLNLCNLVKFAKYKPKDEDFERIVELAHENLRTDIAIQRIAINHAPKERH